LIRILSSDQQQAELKKSAVDEAAIVWVNTLDELIGEPAEAYIDLMFAPSRERISALIKLLPATVIIHAVAETLGSMQVAFTRINAWPGFLERPVIECSLPSSMNTDTLNGISAALKKDFVILPDVPGFVSARVISMIINEAYYALEEGVSSRTEIDIAMKTGTNYPYGPFEWAGKIGIGSIHQLLAELSKTDIRYQPAALLERESVGAALKFP
jgi:3-hydroxybutyryl-CoA dehydrogenase